MHLVPRLIIVCTLHAVACAAEADPPPSIMPPYSADYAPVLSGVSDRGRDSSIVALCMLELTRGLGETTL